MISPAPLITWKQLVVSLDFYLVTTLELADEVDYESITRAK